MKLSVIEGSFEVCKNLCNFTRLGIFVHLSDWRKLFPNLHRINIEVFTNKPLKFVRTYGCLTSLRHEEILFKGNYTYISSNTCKINSLLCYKILFTGKSCRKLEPLNDASGISRFSCLSHENSESAAAPTGFIVDRRQSYLDRRLCNIK